MDKELPVSAWPEWKIDLNYCKEAYEEDVSYALSNSSSSLARPVKPIDGTVFCSPADGFSVFTADKKQLRMSMIDKDGKIIHTVSKAKK